MSFTFKRREDVERLIQIAREEGPTGGGFGETSFVSEGFILKTPAGGIPAMTGDTPGKAECTPYQLNSETESLEPTYDDDTTWPVYNIAPGDVAGDRYIQAKRCLGALFVDMEACPE